MQYKKNEIMDFLHNGFASRIDSARDPNAKIDMRYRPPGVYQDMKRSQARNIQLYSLVDIQNIRFYNNDGHYLLRFVVTSDFKLTVAEYDKPSSTFPDHLEMTESKLCIAAGLIELDHNKKITKLISGCLEYNTDQSSMVWPLAILLLNSELFNPKFLLIQRRYDEVNDYDEMSVHVYRSDIALCLREICVNDLIKKNLETGPERKIIAKDPRKRSISINIPFPGLDEPPKKRLGLFSQISENSFSLANVVPAQIPALTPMAHVVSDDSSEEGDNDTVNQDSVFRPIG